MEHAGRIFFTSNRGKEEKSAMAKTLSIIHTVPVTIQSLSEICARQLPGVEVRHYLDDSILKQINREGTISPQVRWRFQGLVALAAAGKPDAILSACSSVGEMMEETRQLCTMPVLRIDEPMAAQAAQRRGSIVVCATVPSTLGPTGNLIRRYVGEGREVASLLIEGAGVLLNSGDREGYLHLIASRLEEAANRYDTVVLAQASMAEAAQRAPKALQEKFLTSPESGVAAVKPYLGL